MSRFALLCPRLKFLRTKCVSAKHVMTLCNLRDFFFNKKMISYNVKCINNRGVTLIWWHWRVTCKFATLISQSFTRSKVAIVSFLFSRKLISQNFFVHFHLSARCYALSKIITLWNRCTRIFTLSSKYCLDIVHMQSR